MNARMLLAIVVLIAAAVASWLLSRQTGDDARPAPPRDSASLGYYLKNARILGTDVDGRQLYEINAQSAEQVGENRIEFADVSIRYSPESDVPWSVVADSATLMPDTEQVRLTGHVRALSSEGFSGNDTEIRTDVLIINPVAYTAETNERVQIRIGARSLTATGMIASLNDNRLKLLSNVSGKFVP